jgi:hypothetical protein
LIIVTSLKRGANETLNIVRLDLDNLKNIAQVQARPESGQMFTEKKAQHSKYWAFHTFPDS